MTKPTLAIHQDKTFEIQYNFLATLNPVTAAIVSKVAPCCISFEAIVFVYCISIMIISCWLLRTFRSTRLNLSSL
jgi:hypothetical protein